MALRVRIAALALLPNVEKQGGCSGLLVFGLFISLFIVNVDFASIAKLYHAKFDDVATGLHHREIISRSAITSVFAQLSSKMSPYGCACEAGEVRWCSAGLDPSGNAGEKLSLIANTLNQGRGAF